MKKASAYALNTMNYLFLREVFNKNYDHYDCMLSEVIKEELSLFLEAISEEEWTLEFDSLIRTELSDGTYFNSISLDDAIDNLKRTIIDIYHELDDVILTRYSNIFKDIYFEKKLLYSSFLLQFCTSS